MPPFDNLRQVNHAEDEFDGDRPQPIESPVTQFDNRVKLLKAVVPPAERGDEPTIYFDPDIFPTELSRGRVMDSFRREHPDVEFTVQEIRASQLEFWSFTRYASAEKIFLKRGYISNVEIEGFVQGERAPETMHVARNRLAAWRQLTVIADLSPVYEPAAKSWRPPPAGAGDAIAEAFVRLETSLRGLVGERRRAPLVRRDGVFLPCEHLQGEGDVVYLAASGVLEAAIADGRNDPFRLSSALPGELAEQVRFESDNSVHLFRTATSAALRLWQTQVLAYQRVAAWNVDFYNGKKLHDVTSNTRKALERDRVLQRMRAQVRQGAHDVDDFDRLGMPEDTAVRDIVHAFMDELREVIAVPAGVGCRRRLEDAEHFVAALHGSTYTPLSTPRPMSEEELRYRHLEDPLSFLLPVASWLGELKRQRRAVLDRNIASLLREISADSDNLGLRQFIPLIEDRLGGNAWAVLFKACNELLDDEARQPVEVAYVWIRDPEQLWNAQRLAADKIRICGPLLDFPIREANRWNDRAAALWSPELETFVHRARGPERPAG